LLHQTKRTFTLRGFINNFQNIIFYWLNLNSRCPFSMNNYFIFELIFFIFAKTKAVSVPRNVTDNFKIQ
jgi:hypothetical protein